MSTRAKSFWSTMPGLITGLAGILTAVVGLGTLLIQVGVIGGGDDDSTPKSETGATATTPAGGGRSDGSDDSGTATTPPKFTVAPQELRLTAGDKTGNVTVSNTGGAAFTLASEITGTGKDEFTLKKGTCGAEVPKSGSCTMTVEFKGGLAATAKLVVTVRGASPSQQTADLEGSLL